jgi:iron complex transport system ATP-binding protein
VSVLQLDRACASPWGRPLLQDISLELAPGEILALAGPNGAGKSSLLQLITGDIPVASGGLLLDGRTLADWPGRELARRRAYLPQLSLLNFPYTVAEVVALGRMPHDTGRAADREIVAQALAATDVSDLAGRLYTQLSGGEKQRVQLARVFAQIWQAGAGGLLLLDEPTTALDLSHQQLVLAAVSALAAAGCAIILAIHDLNLAAGLARRVALLDGGRLAAIGPPAEVYTEQLIRDIFGIEVLIQQHPLYPQPLVVSR